MENRWPIERPLDDLAHPLAEGYRRLHRKPTCIYVDESPYYLLSLTRIRYRLHYRSGDSVRSYSYALSHAVAYVSVHVRAMHSGGCLPFSEF